MGLRQVGAVLMTYLTACAGTPRALYAESDPAEAELAAARYELHVLTAGSGPSEPVEVAREDFQRAMRVLARGYRPGAQPAESAHWLMEGALQGTLLAEVERERVVRLMPLEDDSPLDVASAAEARRKYLGLCQRDHGGGDCLGLLADGPVLTREDLRTLGLALALKEVLKETGVALKGMVSPQALVGMLVWTCCVYLTLWLLPEPVSKVLAASLTVALLAWLPVSTLWSLMEGWGRLVHEVDRATSFEQVEEASAKFSKLMGENTAHVLVLVVTAAITGGAARFSAQLPKLPGFALAEARAGAQGMSLAEAREVEAAAIAEEQTVTFMVRRPGSRAAAVAEEAAEGRAGATLIIRHRGGNRQVRIHNQRWHVPANRSIRDIPAKDPVGDVLQAAALRVRDAWDRGKLEDREVRAIREAIRQGDYIRARLMERMFRGKWVEQQLRLEFPELKWNPKGVDAVDPATGLKYEILTGTNWNMELHGRRMVEEFFRMITF
ncbi:SitA5 family polymorphic toxin [Hyalangium versicolor]|uniref:SitA5 family polymorphic toxin n=1 Tax=Hyalangium versicolor TaxID=2861190 RepID=UPI001CCA267D|nr:hypothetical protein [Hyalangium versicolor]